MKRNKRSKEVQAKLDTIKHSRERELMPRPTVFRDKTKYNRNALKQNDRRYCYA